jgi:hypothetical protein
LECGVCASDFGSKRSSSETLLGKKRQISHLATPRASEAPPRPPLLAARSRLVWWPARASWQAALAPRLR